MSDKTIQDLKVDAHIAVLHTKVDALVEKQKELTARVRANEKVVAAVTLLGTVVLAVIGAGYFAPKAEAFPRYLEPRDQVIDGSLPPSASMANDVVNKFRQWELEQSIRDPEFDINNALAEYFNGSDETAEQEELLQLSSNRD